MVWEEKSVSNKLPCMQIFCNLGSGYLATDYMSFLQIPGTEGQNMRLKQAESYKSSMNTVLFVNATIGFSKNLFLVQY